MGETELVRDEISYYDYSCFQVWSIDSIIWRHLNLIIRCIC